MKLKHSHLVISAPVVAAALLLACQSRIPEPESRSSQEPPTLASSPEPLKSDAPPKKEPKIRAKPVATVKVSEDDPLKGVFTLADAEKDLPGSGKLIADLETDAGKLVCELFSDKAPITVANFVGLARGLRPFKLKDKWLKQPAYDGLTFHRIIKGFMVQGGDPNGDGSGQPGYNIPDEIWEDALHDRPGLLCMANAGPNTNGMQFFITHKAAAHLDNNYTIFGECKPTSVVDKLAETEVAGERPVKAPKIVKVTIRHELATAPAGSGSAATSASAASPAAPSAAPSAAAPTKPAGSAH